MYYIYIVKHSINQNRKAMKTMTFTQALKKLKTDYNKIWGIEFEYNKADKLNHQTAEIRVWNKLDKHCFNDIDLINDFYNLGFYVIIVYSVAKDRLEVIIYK